MKPSLPMLSMLLASLVITACAVDPAPGEDERTEERVTEDENTGESASELRLDDSKYCLPGETVHCTLGPPPVCRCVPKDPPILVAW